MLTIDERIENGIRWLNENFPNWIDRVDLDILALSDPFKCICGQVFSSPEFDTERGENESGYTYAVTLLNEANSWISPIYDNNPSMLKFTKKIGQKSRRQYCHSFGL